MGMLLHRHWLETQEASAKAKEEPKEDKPKRAKKTKGEE